jgi:hypothetical protein
MFDQSACLAIARAAILFRHELLTAPGPIPAWDDVKKNLPPAIAARPTRIVWNLVCSAYVPELAIPWSVGTRTIWAEAKPERVFEESLFRVRTRSIRRNYCMGHCEMLMEVAGLSKTEIGQRTRILSGDDWSSFPPEEQRAFAFARTLTRAPWTVTAEDIRGLERDFGSERTLAVIYNSCWGNYMTRVSNGFQLRLERDNIFFDGFSRETVPAGRATATSSK